MNVTIWFGSPTQNCIFKYPIVTFRVVRAPVGSPAKNQNTNETPQNWGSRYPHGANSEICSQIQKKKKRNTNFTGCRASLKVDYRSISPRSQFCWRRGGANSKTCSQVLKPPKFDNFFYENHLRATLYQTL